MSETTLLIPFGGTGCVVSELLKKQLENDTPDIRFLCFDTDDLSPDDAEKISESDSSEDDVH